MSMQGSTCIADCLDCDSDTVPLAVGAELARAMPIVQGAADGTDAGDQGLTGEQGPGAGLKVRSRR